MPYHGKLLVKILQYLLSNNLNYMQAHVNFNRTHNKYETIVLSALSASVGKIENKILHRRV